jgi:hypothetical protein
LTGFRPILKLKQGIVLFRKFTGVGTSLVVDWVFQTKNLHFKIREKEGL